MFLSDAPGTLVPITGTDPALGPWEHRAFIPDPLGDATPPLSTQSNIAIANARAALAALDSTARQLPNPTLLRLPTLRREAQSTSELEGTYAPLADVLTADEENPGTTQLVEILNYVRMAGYGFDRVVAGHPLSLSFLSELQGILMKGTELQDVSGRLRDGQVVVGRQDGADPFDFPVIAARFVPPPADFRLETGVRDLTDWIRIDRRDRMDPVVSAALAHYQFETLHPYRDGNGRLGRFLIVAQLLAQGVLTEPTLSVSGWFEQRRRRYYDALLGVSTRGDWDTWVGFFASGLTEAAQETRHQMTALVAVQSELKERVRASALRADTAHNLVDLAVANPSFTVRRVQSELGVTYGRANKLVGQLVDLGILRVVDPDAYKRRFVAPQVLSVLTGT